MVGLMMLLLFPLHASAETLMVYTAVEAEDLKRYAAAFNKDHPDIKIRWVRIPPESSPPSCLRKKQPTGRCDLGTGRNQPDAAQVRGHVATLLA